MKASKSINVLIESIDSIISKNRSSFSPEECRSLEGVKLKLIEVKTQNISGNKSQRNTFVQSIILELLKLLLDPNTWDKIKHIL